MRELIETFMYVVKEAKRQVAVGMCYRVLAKPQAATVLYFIKEAKAEPIGSPPPVWFYYVDYAGY